MTTIPDLGRQAAKNAHHRRHHRTRRSDVDHEVCLLLVSLAALSLCLPLGLEGRISLLPRLLGSTARHRAVTRIVAKPNAHLCRYSVGGKKIGPDDPISDHVGDIIGGGDTGVGSGGEDEVVKRWFGL
jgi:hypothetical protein